MDLDRWREAISMGQKRHMQEQGIQRLRRAVAPFHSLWFEVVHLGKLDLVLEGRELPVEPVWWAIRPIPHRVSVDTV